MQSGALPRAMTNALLSACERPPVTVWDEFGEFVGAIEAKAGAFARYSFWQRVKDAYLMATLEKPIFLYRIPCSKPWFPW
jgi:hypothetical protein